MNQHAFLPADPELAAKSLTLYARMSADAHVAPVDTMWLAQVTARDIAALSLVFDTAADLATSLADKDVAAVIRKLRALVRTAPDDHKRLADLWDEIEDIAASVATDERERDMEGW